MTDTRDKIVEDVRAMMRRLAKLGHPFTHTVWETEQQVQSSRSSHGFMVYRAQSGNTTPVVAWLDQTGDGFTLLSTRRVGDQEVVEAIVEFDVATLGRLEERLRPAFY